MRQILEKMLKNLAKRVLNKYKPEVIGITGSVGKTSTKEAVFTILKDKFRVRASQGNYNNEIGVPLTILGVETGRKSIFHWFNIFFKAMGLILKKNNNYPQILVLEMAADHPGDIRYLTQLAPCKIGILTRIAPAHYEFFGSLEKIAQEKEILLTHLSKEGLAIINYDDILVNPMKNRVKAKVLTFGLQEANIKGSDILINQSRGERLEVQGTSFKVTYQGNVVPVFLPGVLGKNHVYASLAAIVVGLSYDLNLVEIAESLRGYKPSRGRMNIVHGVKYTTLIDDTYNASPISCISALEIMKEISIDENDKRVAVFGNMLELGDYTAEGHRQVGRKAAELGIDLLVTVGELALHIAQGAKEAGMNEEKIFSFDHHEEAGRFIQNRIKQGDLILVKGSQGARMEYIVKELMAEPLRACELLVRQDPAWQCG